MAFLHGRQEVVMKSRSVSSPGRPLGNSTVRPAESSNTNDALREIDFDSDGNGGGTIVGGEAMGPGTLAAGGRQSGAGRAVFKSGRLGVTPGAVADGGGRTDSLPGPGVVIGAVG